MLRRHCHLNSKLLHLPPSELSIRHVHVVAVPLPGLLSFVSFPSQPLCPDTLSCVLSPHVPSLCPSASPRFAFDCLAVPRSNDMHPGHLAVNHVKFTLSSEAGRARLFVFVPWHCHNHFQIASIPSLFGGFSPHNSRQPNADSIPHNDLRRRRCDTQVDAILPHARQLPERSSCSLPFQQDSFSECHAFHFG